jgi:hypothetical protein
VDVKCCCVKITTQSGHFGKRKLRDILWQGAGSKRGLEVIAYGALHDQVKKNEIGGLYSMYEGEEKCIKGSGGKTQWNESQKKQAEVGG